MDHLETPEMRENGIHFCEPIEWLGFEGHDVPQHVDFLMDYPKSRGWQLEFFLLGLPNDDGTHRDETSLETHLVKDGHGNQPSECSLFSFLQCFLFVGFLESLMRCRIDIRTLTSAIKGDDSGSAGGKETLHTKNLASLVDDWANRVGKCSVEEEAEWASSTAENFCLLSSLWYRITLNRVKCDIPSYFWPTVRALSVLHKSMLYISLFVFRRPESGWRSLYDRLGSKSRSLVQFGDAERSLQHQLLSKGYCPFQLENTKKSGLPWFLMEYMNANSARLVDGSTLAENIHGNCDEKECKTYHVTNATMRAMRARCSCGGDCAKLCPEVDEVVAALENGAIPCVSYPLQEEAGTPSKLEVLQVNEGEPYVAFSHVWADGLGSTTEDGLFECEVVRLRHLAKTALEEALGRDDESNEPIRFWIDSLCIPERDGVRKKAIGAMAATYAKATVVVVIDKIVREAVFPGCPEVDMFLRILISGWNFRLWTLQEAWLAQRLAFEVKTTGADTTIFMYPIMERYLRYNFEPGSPGYSQIGMIRGLQEAVVPHTILRDLWYLRPALKQEGLVVSQASQLLSRRRTSRLSDETLAIAPLLGIPVEGLYGLPHDQRIIQLFIRLRRLPSYIPMLTGPRLTFPNFSWAPSTFMVEDGLRNDECPYGIVTQNGFFASYRVLLPLPQFKWRGVVNQSYHMVVSGKTDDLFKFAPIEHSPPNVEFFVFNAILLDPSQDESRRGLAVYMDGSRWTDENDELAPESSEIRGQDSQRKSATPWLNCSPVGIFNLGEGIADRRLKESIINEIVECEYHPGGNRVRLGTINLGGRRTSKWGRKKRYGI